MNTHNDWTLEIGRLIALAERCASEGQMNMNKLLEAAVYAEDRRFGWRYRPHVTLTTMEAELEASLQFLRRENAAPNLITAMEFGQQALAEHRHGDLLISEAPDVFVCRTCGYAALETAPDYCPDCGAWAGRFRKFVAFFNRDNIEPINPMDVLALLIHNAEDLTRLVDGLSEEEATRAHSDVDWSIQEHVAHFYDTQGMLDTRIELMLNYDNPELPALAVYELAKEIENHPSTSRDLLSAFNEKRTRCIAQLESLPLKDLWRTGHHPEFGQLTIVRQAAYLAFHEQTHLPEIEALKRQVARG